mmetsp:Transcript_14244/g.36904  ORF Transcript_14244/g.36904 Transcript_14244/m.36904 type:complete len:199 (+) Transcript_14244:55-651(+)
MRAGVTALTSAMLGLTSTGTSSARVDLRTPAAFRAYLEGRWRVNKRLDYATPAEWRGTMSGVVTVAPRSSQPSVLMWHEEGEMCLDARPALSIATHKNLAFQCRDDWPVSVFFVDGEVTDARDDGWGVAKGQGLFVELAPDRGGVVQFSFDHLCINDMYSGAMVFESPERFRWSWTIRGPKKDGHIIQEFERLHPEET